MLRYIMRRSPLNTAAIWPQMIMVMVNIAKPIETPRAPRKVVELL